MIGTIYLYSVLLFALVSVSAAFFFGTRVVFRTIATARNNARMAVTTVRARIVGKRTDPTGVIDDARSTVSCRITFEVAGGRRVGFDVVGREFLHLRIGDEGLLTAQGTRFVEFDERGLQQDTD